MRAPSIKPVLPSTGREGGGGNTATYRLLPLLRITATQQLICEIFCLHQSSAYCKSDHATITTAQLYQHNNNSNSNINTTLLQEEQYYCYNRVTATLSITIHNRPPPRLRPSKQRNNYRMKTQQPPQLLHLQYNCPYNNTATYTTTQLPQQRHSYPNNNTATQTTTLLPQQ